MKTFTTKTGLSCIVMDYGKNAIVSKNIKYIEGDGNYSKIKLDQGKSLISSFTLRTFCKELNHDKNFFSPRKGLLINLNYVNEIVVRGKSKYAKMRDGSELSISRRRGKEFLEFIKENHWDIDFLTA
jgi:DNA-binding LytR/AlgR family response regulator